MEARTRERKQVAMQVLIVEDDVRLAQALAHILAENGYQTDSCTTVPPASPTPNAATTT